MLTTLDIKAELMRRGTSPAALARELGVHKSTVTRTINGESRNFAILEAVAARIGVPVETLAPGRSPQPPEPNPTNHSQAESMADCQEFPPARAAGVTR